MRSGGLRWVNWRVLRGWSRHMMNIAYLLVYFIILGGLRFGFSLLLWNGLLSSLTHVLQSGKMVNWGKVCFVIMSHNKTCFSVPNFVIFILMFCVMYSPQITTDVSLYDAKRLTGYLKACQAVVNNAKHDTNLINQFHAALDNKDIKVSFKIPSHYFTYQLSKIWYCRWLELSI